MRTPVDLVAVASALWWRRYKELSIGYVTTRPLERGRRRHLVLEAELACPVPSRLSGVLPPIREPQRRETLPSPGFDDEEQ